MSLPSQGGRTSGGMVGRGRRRRKRGKSPLGAFLAIAVVGAVGWLVVSKAGGMLGDGPAKADASPGLNEPVPGPGAASETAVAPLHTPATTAQKTQTTPAETQPKVRLPDPLEQKPVAQKDPAPSVALPAEPKTQPTTQQTSQPAMQPAARPSVTFAQAVAECDRLVAENRLVDARAVLNRELVGGGLDAVQASQARERLARINQDLFFSPRVVPGDPMCETYTIESGDSLAKIAAKRNLACDWRLVQRVNRISDPRRIRVGQQIKLVRGPFHAVVDKSDFRLDVYAGPPGLRSDWIYINSYPVGLGEADGTPVGQFVVRADSKLINPYWVNPRTGERFEADDPMNPIGEHWIGLDGVGEAAAFTGYGIHGTIDPESIGRSRSMGCVRMRDGDVAVVYEMLVEGISEVEIRE